MKKGIELIKEQEKALLDKEKERNDQYLAAVKGGDKAFAKKDWQTAITAYEQALTIKSEELYPKEQIEKVNKLLLEEKAGKEASELAAKNAAEAKALAEKQAKEKAEADALAKKQAEELAAKNAAEAAAAKTLAEKQAKEKAEADALAKKQAEVLAAKNAAEAAAAKALA
ncbi:MAG: hypothetical protein MUF75_06040, partial [Bacteroidia bacterium]|nr:hypothetical protein [Bacteroidia bacterium]